ncbi:MAG: sulfotransferase domain-containing protein [Geitlerinemataceae cyanobacterium]
MSHHSNASRASSAPNAPSAPNAKLSRWKSRLKTAIARRGYPLAIAVAERLDPTGDRGLRNNIYRAALPRVPHSEPLWELAALHRNRQAWPQLADLYRELLVRFPQEDETELHGTLAEAQQWPQIVRALAAAGAAGCGTALTYQRLGHAHCQQQQWLEAAIAYRESIRREPESYWAQHGLGLASLRQEQWTEASAAFARALAIEPGALRSRVQLCRTLAHQRQWRECCQTLAVLLAEHRDALTPVGPWLKRFEGLDLAAPWPDEFESFSIAIETFIDAGAYFKLEDRPDAKPIDLAPVADLCFRHAIERFPTAAWHHFFYFNRLLIRFRNQDRLDELGALFRAASAAAPDARDAYLNLAAVANFGGDNRTAAIAYATLLDREAGLGACLQTREASKTLPATETRLSPSFFIIGVQKGGTTSLHSYLCAHPQIVSGAHKEIDFWSVEYDRGLAWYMSQFPPRRADRAWITGEASNTSIDHPDAPARLHAALPDAKLVAVLRDPTERAISHYYQRYRERNLIGPIEQFLRSELEFARAHPPETVTAELFTTHLRGRAISRGLYSTFLKRWLQYFPKSSLLAIDSQEFFSDTGAVVERVQRFIGLEPQGLETYPIFNPGSYRHISPELEAELRDFFRPYNRELAALLDFEHHWK